MSADPKKADALGRARRRISREIDEQSAFAVAKLRLNAGLSQAVLAKLMGTQQPAIARLEKGETEPNLSTMLKLAEALGVTPQVVMSAFISAKEMRGK